MFAEGEGHAILMALSFRVLVEPLAIESKHNTRKPLKQNKTKKNVTHGNQRGGKGK